MSKFIITMWICYMFELKTRAKQKYFNRVFHCVFNESIWTFKNQTRLNVCRSEWKSQTEKTNTTDSTTQHTHMIHNNTARPSVHLSFSFVLYLIWDLVSVSRPRWVNPRQCDDHIQTRWLSAGSGIFNTTWKQSFCNLVTNKIKKRMF